MRGVLLLLVLLVAAAGVAVLLLRTVAQTEVTDRLTIPRGVRALDVATDTGSVRVTGRPGPVSVAVTRRYGLVAPTVEDRVVGGALVLRADCPGVGWLVGCEVGYAAEVPPAVAVRVEADAGSVEVRGVGGPLRAESNAGGVTAQGLRSRAITARTDAGDVRVEALAPPARVDARSRAGDVEVVVPAGPYRVDAGTRVGDVTVEGVIRDERAPRAITARTDAGDVTVRGR